MIAPAIGRIRPVADLQDSRGILKMPNDCEHEHLSDNGTECLDCNMKFIVCRPCSISGGADMAIYHEPPECTRYCERRDCGRLLEATNVAVYCSNECAYLDA